jgi:hypothetical protein
MLSQWDAEKRHREAVARKYERIEGLRALLETWEENPAADPEYIRDLHRRLHSARTQLKAMAVMDE